MLVLGIIFVVAVMRQHAAKVRHSSANSGLQQKTISIGKATLQVELAQTPEEKTIGLSHRNSLAEGKGMLFLFENEGKHGFWMKDTHFPIDIIWINAEKKVIHIADNVAPDTYPQSFAPSVPALYVLEVPAGYTKGRITLGSTLVLK